MTNENITLSSVFTQEYFDWYLNEENVLFDKKSIKSKLLNIDNHCYIVKNGSRFGLSDASQKFKKGNISPVTLVPAFKIENLGDPSFSESHGTKYNLYAGAMAKAIASEEMVISMGKNGFMGSFGAGGLTPERIEAAIYKIKEGLNNGEPYIFNLLHNPFEPKIERETVELYLKHGVPCVEAAAFIALSLPLVQYRVTGLRKDSDGRIHIKNKVIAKISRREVAKRFMEPPPVEMIDDLLKAGKITKDEAKLSQFIPVADDITIEADSGGHTDNRALVALLPSILELNDEMMKKYNYSSHVRIGAAGGIGTPQAALAAFMMGAAYVVTGSVNQCCVESGSSEHTRKLLSEADMADVTMAPAADMFEMGVKVQVLKRGTLFPMKARKLYEIYNEYSSVDEIPSEIRERLETQIFKRKIEDIWKDTVEFFKRVDISQIEEADRDPRKKMALIFRWYLGLASHWANTGDSDRYADYQIWCGPSMGAFNMWVKGSDLEKIENRKVALVAENILRGAAYLKRIQDLKFKGVNLDSEIRKYEPVI